METRTGEQVFLGSSRNLKYGGIRIVFHMKKSWIDGWFGHEVPGVKGVAKVAFFNKSVLRRGTRSGKNVHEARS